MYNLKYIFLFVEEKLIVYMPNMSLLLLNEIWTNDHLILNTTVYFGIENKYIQIKGYEIFMVPSLPHESGKWYLVMLNQDHLGIELDNQQTPLSLYWAIVVEAS